MRIKDTFLDDTCFARSIACGLRPDDEGRGMTQMVN